MTNDSALVATEYAHIAKPADGSKREARIIGHRIRVRDVIAMRDSAGNTAEEIAATVYPSLTLAQVYAAFAYYEDHRDEIDQHDSDESAAVEDFAQRFPQVAIDLRPRDTGT